MAIRFGSTLMLTLRFIQRPSLPTIDEEFSKILTAMADAQQAIGQLDILESSERESNLAGME